MERVKNNISQTDGAISSYACFCSSCGSDHTFPGGECRLFAQALMERLSARKDIGSNSLGPGGTNRLSTDPLFGESRGKMFGVMECLAADGATVFCKAFSGQFNGLWLVEGWAPPLFDLDEWTRVNTGPELTIKRLSREIQACRDEHARRNLQRERRDLSRRLMKDLHALYQLTNFRGLTLPLTDIFPDKTGIPTGTGDCCAPKLLNFAATHNLLPIGMSEFYWGRENRSANRRHGHFYLPCIEKCRPILGFMLCGLRELHVRK